MSGQIAAFRTLEEATGGVALGGDSSDHDVKRHVESDQKLSDRIDSAMQDVEFRTRGDDDFKAVVEFDRKARERYGRSGADAVGESHYWAERFKSDPVGAQSEFVSARMRDGVNAFRKFDDPPDRETKSEDDVHTFVKLDRILDKAIDEAEARPHQEAVYQDFMEKAGGKLFDIMGAPGISQKDQLETLSTFLDAQHRDPYAVAVKLAAMNNAPVTDQDWRQVQTEVQRQQHEDNLAQELTALQAQGHLQHLDNPQVQRDMITLFESPEFPRSGNVLHDAINAHSLAVEAAVMRQTQTDRQTVEKAQRAAPIKTSNAMKHAAREDDGSLDGVINSALANW